MQVFGASAHAKRSVFQADTLKKCVCVCVCVSLCVSVCTVSDYLALLTTTLNNITFVCNGSAVIVQRAQSSIDTERAMHPNNLFENKSLLILNVYSLLVNACECAPLMAM